MEHKKEQKKKNPSLASGPKNTQAQAWAHVTITKL
jgi:hypothetical protein